MPLCLNIAKIASLLNILEYKYKASKRLLFPTLFLPNIKLNLLKLSTLNSLKHLKLLMLIFGI